MVKTQSTFTNYLLPLHRRAGALDNPDSITNSASIVALALANSDATCIDSFWRDRQTGRIGL